MRIFAVLLVIVACFSKPNAHAQCNKERGDVKTLTDSDTSEIRWNPVTINLDSIVRAPAQRFDFEKQVVRLRARAYGVERESDGDVHLLLEDSLGNSIIAEVPNPDCPDVAGSGHVAEFAAVRSWISDSLARPTSHLKPVDRMVTVTGLLFQDLPHPKEQTGVSLNLRRDSSRAIR